MRKLTTLWRRFWIPELLLVSALSAASAPPAQLTNDFYTPAQDAAALDIPGDMVKSLPNVLLLGDSISIGYTKQVRQILQGQVNVVRPKANCGDTRAGLTNLTAWLGKTHWDVIHFNWGLHDLCYRHPEAKVYGNRDKQRGTISVPLDQYEKNLETLVKQLKSTGATLIWASTTKVPEGEAGRFVGDEVKYNTAAARVMAKNGVAIDDLYALSETFPPNWSVAPGDVHFNSHGSDALAGQVAEAIEKALASRPKP
jgi:lysophospholipase L1-like esterase